MTYFAATHRLSILAMVVALAACGGETEPAPQPGPEEPAPAPAPPPSDELSISISPRSGSHDTDVTINASGFEPGARVGIGIGPPQSEYDIITHATADADGTVTTVVNLPDWTDQGRDYLFVARAPSGEDVISSAFRVTAGDGDGDGRDGDEPGRVRVTGMLTGEGVECPALRGDDDRLYTLTGDLGGFGEGDRVEVEGTVAEMSICMQGTTIEVAGIRSAG